MGGKSMQMKKSGSIDTHCGTYKYNIKPPYGSPGSEDNTKLTCNTASNHDAQNRKFSRDGVAERIEIVCGDLVTMGVKLSVDSKHPGVADDPYASDSAKGGGDISESESHMAMIPSYRGDSDICHGLDFTWPNMGDHCIRSFMEIVDGCEFKPSFFLPSACSFSC